MATSSNKTVITICGGGNCSHILAGVLGSDPSNEVRLLTRKPAEWKHNIQVIIKQKPDEPINGTLAQISDNPKDVIPGSKWLIMACPVFAHGPIAESIAPHVDDGAIIGTVFAQGGFDWKVKKALRNAGRDVSRFVIFGIQHIPWSCRNIKYGEIGGWLGVKTYLNLAAIPSGKTPEIAADIERMFKIPTRRLPNFLSIHLTPSNQIIHPARMYGLYHEDFAEDAFGNGKTYPRVPYFYRELNQFSVDVMQHQSDEIQAIRRAIEKLRPDVNLTEVMDLGDRVVKMYGKEVGDTNSLLKIMSTNDGWLNHTVPMHVIKNPDGPDTYRPDFTTRYMWDDVPFGLVILRSIADMIGVQTPWVDKVIVWSQKIMKKEYLVDNKLTGKDIGETGAIQVFSISTFDDLIGM